MEKSCLLANSMTNPENDEDFALGQAIEAGLLSESVSRKELDKALYTD